MKSNERENNYKEVHYKHYIIIFLVYSVSGIKRNVVSND